MGWSYSMSNPVDPGPLPRYSSAPKFPRAGTKRWKTSQFLQVQEPRHAVNNTAASITPATWRLGVPASTQSPQAGRKIRRAGLLSPVNPQSSPNRVQRPRVSPDRKRNASTTTQEKRNVVSDV